jgi:hypothetical protein
MAFSPGSNKNIILVNTSNAPQTIILPLLSDYPDRFLYVKDVTTLAPESTYTNYITIQTSNSDIFENGNNSVQIETQFTNYTFYANPYTNCWNTLNYYDTSFLQIKDTVSGFLNIITTLSNFQTEIEELFSLIQSSFLNGLLTIVPQQNTYLVDTIVDISYNTITYPFYNITTPLDPSPTINNPDDYTTWSLTTSFNGLLSNSSLSIATYINISNTLNNQYVSGNLFNSNTPYISYIPALTSGGLFPTRTTFTYKDTYNTDINSSNILSNGSPYNINMYVCIINDNNGGKSEYRFIDGQFEVSLTPIVF